MATSSCYQSMSFYWDSCWPYIGGPARVYRGNRLQLERASHWERGDPISESPPSNATLVSFLFQPPVGAATLSSGVLMSSATSLGLWAESPTQG